MAADTTYPNSFQIRADGNAAVPTGKSLDIESGGALKIAGTDKTAALAAVPSTVANAVVGVAAGYKIARSAAPVSLDGSNPTSFAHGLTTCVSVVVQLVGSAAPGDSTSVLTAVINGANVDVYAWKHTTGGAAGDPTLIASTGTETFNWIAVGT